MATHSEGMMTWVDSSALTRARTTAIHRHLFPLAGMWKPPALLKSSLDDKVMFTFLLEYITQKTFLFVILEAGTCRAWPDLCKKRKHLEVRRQSCYMQVAAPL